MAQQLKTLADLAKDPDLVPSTHMVYNNCLQLQFQGESQPLASNGTCT